MLVHGHHFEYTVSHVNSAQFTHMLRSKFDHNAIILELLNVKLHASTGHSELVNCFYDGTSNAPQSAPYSININFMSIIFMKWDLYHDLSSYAYWQRRRVKKRPATEWILTWKYSVYRFNEIQCEQYSVVCMCGSCGSICYNNKWKLIEPSETHYIVRVKGCVLLFVTLIT